MPNADVHAIADVSNKDLKDRAQKISALLDQVDALMSDAVVLTDEDRLHAIRMRGAIEAEALNGVLDFADKHPEVFSVLAAEDAGKDGAVFETDVVRGRVANAAILQGLAERVDTTRRAITDSALYIASLAKPPALAAYEIAKPLAARDRVNGKLLNAALNFYKGIGKAAATTRRTKKTTD